MEIVFATFNKGKIIEMRALLEDLDVEVLSLEEVGINSDIVEDGETFEENALKKARFASQRSGKWAVADDSGICIKALDYRPGVLSARWAGEGASDEELIEHTLKEMSDISEEDRQAYFESALALVSPDGREWIFIGRIHGLLAEESRGTPLRGLPYDVIFIPEGEARTFAQMLGEEKNTMSHRGKAFKRLKDFLKDNYLKK